jgi:curli biogenesis system outer membrane secretion channel CsgG
MKPISLALVAALALAGSSAQAQTATQSPPPASAPAAESSHPKLSHDCKEEVKKVCGRAHGQEMTDCVKSSLDLNKFSASCKSELTAKPGG